MRIISKVKDVYDLQGTMYDAERVWYREEIKQVVNVPADFEQIIFYANLFETVKNGKFGVYQLGTLEIRPVLICGTLRWLYGYHTYRPNGGNTWTGYHFQTFEPAKVIELMEEEGLSVRLGWETNTIEKIDAYVRNATATASAFLETFNKPIAMAWDAAKSKTDPTVNITVKTDFNFHAEDFPWQEIDPNLYRWHQTLESYIFGVLGQGEPKTESTSDRDRLIAKGFDAKVSFRNMER